MKDAVPSDKLQNPSGSEHERAEAPGRLRGLLFDGAVLIGYVALSLDVLPTPHVISDIGPTDEPGPTEGLWLLCAVGAQWLGAAFKARPLQRRLAGYDGMIGVNAMLLTHFILFLIVNAVAFSLLGWSPEVSQDTLTLNEGIWGLAIFVVAGGTTLTVGYAADTGGTKAPPGFPGREAVGDVLLFISVVILSVFLWEPLAELMTATDARGLTLAGRLLFAGAALLLFAVFYVPSRLLFLVEDGASGRTWFQVGLVASPLIWRVLAG